MKPFLRLLLISPRLTIMVIVLIVGAITGRLTHQPTKHKAANPWGTASSEPYYTAQKRADDGWGGNTRPVSGGSYGGRTTETVWVDRDGVIHEKEDMKAYDPDAFK